MGHRDSAMGQRYGEWGHLWGVGTALWGSTMGHGDPLIP